MADTLAIKPEKAESPTPNDRPASFAGRLNLTRFKFEPPTPPSRQSPAAQSPTKQELLEESQILPVVVARGELEARSTPTPSLSSIPAFVPTPAQKRRQSGTSPSTSPKKRPKSGYAPPETYAHLGELNDAMAPNLIGIFVGLNPGLMTAAKGHAYSHPSNRFWHLLHSSGLTDRRLKPVEDTTLPAKYQLGNTNIVARPTRNGNELSKMEMDAAVHLLEAKVKRYRPESVIIVGKSIWESIWRVRHGRGIKKHEFHYGWQDERMSPIHRPVEIDGEFIDYWEGARLFVATSTSGLAATPSYPEKEAIWKEVGDWVNKRRKERKEEEKVRSAALARLQNAESASSSAAASNVASAASAAPQIGVVKAEPRAVKAEPSAVKAEVIVDSSDEDIVIRSPRRDRKPSLL